MEDARSFKREVREVWRGLRRERHLRGRLLSADDLNESAARIVAQAEKLKALAMRPEAQSVSARSEDEALSARPAKVKKPVEPKRKAKSASGPKVKPKTKGKKKN